MSKTKNVFGLKAHYSGVARVKMDSAFPNWACRLFFFFSGLLEMTKQMEKHAGEMGNNRAGRGPRLPSTTMGSIISQLRGWLELRSFPFGSTGLHLLLRTLAPFLTSCHHQQFKTLWSLQWGHTLSSGKDAWTHSDIRVFKMAIVKVDELLNAHSAHHYYHLNSFISWTRTAAGVWKKN